eukprot:TRINITY_DN784_c0_g1_i4.p1 TRINITY_DN784_c0_g1~~TRINITY_DN784_c0_g1_i4.p1  ORF type:complete len:212 (-),score=51.99 TRINITY_DN784_c0_g1_i4:263-898(-)
MADVDYDYLYKVVLVGDSGVGKTSILTRYVHNEFNIDSKSTIGIDFATHALTMHNKVFRIQLWDTAGQERFRQSITSAYYRGAIGALIVFSIASRKSFENVKLWVQDAREYADRNLVITLVGNKSDLDRQREVRTDEALEYAQQEGFVYLEVSANTSSNVEQAFRQLVEHIHNQGPSRGKVVLPSEYEDEDMHGGVTISTDEPKVKKSLCC